MKLQETEEDVVKRLSQPKHPGRHFSFQINTKMQLMTEKER